MCAARTWTICLSLLALGSSSAYPAEVPGLDSGDFGYDFERSEFDFKNDIAEFYGRVRVTQGPNSIQAEEAIARAFRSENKQWEFKDSVRVRTADAQLQASTATAAFENNVLVGARVQGSPAEFERIGGDSDRLARGRANVIEYDVSSEVVTLSGDVWFGYGQDEFRGDTVIYSLREERVRVNSGDSGRVRGIIRPRVDGQSDTSPSDAPSGDRAQSGGSLRERSTDEGDA